MAHSHDVQIYYEDTDHSGVVYHANYLKYFERAREHMLGTAELRRLLVEDGVGFVVYKAELAYKKGARFGDTITIETRVTQDSPYRATFHQNATRAGEVLVEGKVQLVCLGPDETLVPLPDSAVDAMSRHAA
jgi:tol-pal system-associated acyl-CoA thioesterase